MILPWMSPVISTAAAAATSVVQAPSCSAVRYGGVSASVAGASRCHSATAATSPPAVRNAPAMVCGKVTSATLLVSTAPKSVQLGPAGVGLIR